MDDATRPAAAFDEAYIRSRLTRMHPISAVDGSVRFSQGDHVLEPSLRPLMEGLTLRPAAVLIPLVLHATGTTVLLTRRTDHLRHHAGQVAFPGGKIDAEDDGPVSAALREAEEEIGLDRRLVEPIGQLDAYVTTTGYDVVPVVGLVEPNPMLTPNPDEVADVFEVPLSFLMAPENHHFEVMNYKGHERKVYSIRYDGRRIWGVTGGIMRLFYDQVFA
ncbi:CoA pyrophosphatase [Hartmannibacter diazotrophicus]|nr:CoA pyrophosphatase [Hartmannibacter diazotrophicus]